MDHSGLFNILRSAPADVDRVFELFGSAIDYQKKNGYNLWPQFGRGLIETEIREGRHWKVVEGAAIACVFSVLYNDPLIWKEKDNEPSVYLHRIAVDPFFKGRWLTSVIKDWAIAHARSVNRKYVRMDTWGNNVNLRNYYIRCGFQYLGQQHLDEIKGLPAHYGGSELSLFQVEA